METIAATSIILALVSSLIVGIDLIKHRPLMKIMSLVWVLTALWAGVFALVAYFVFGRAKSSKKEASQMGMSSDSMAMDDMKMDGMQMDQKVMPTMKMEDMKMPSMQMGGMKMARRPAWQSTTLSTLHCGAGCTLADLAGEWMLFFAPVIVGGSALFGSAIVDYLLALAIGIYFQWVVIRAMNPSSSKWQAVSKAFRADVLSLTAWQVGMYGFMAIVIFGLLGGQAPQKTGWMFWFLMQMAMMAGFVFAYPVNILLIRYGVKKAM